MYQELALIGVLSPIENLFLGREETVGRPPLSLLAKRRMRARGRELLGELGIHLPSLKAKVEELSGGQRQAVAIARALGWGKRVVILDEPTAALGVAESAEVERLIRSLKERGMAVVLVSHRLDQVRDLADRVVVLRHGRVVGRLEGSAIKPGPMAELITGLSDARVT